MAGNKNQITLFHAGARPAQKIGEVGGMPVFIYAEECDVEIVTRIGEVVGIAAEKGRIKFGREYQAHVGELFVLIQVIDLTRIENNDVAAKARGTAAILLDL